MPLTDHARAPRESPRSTTPHLPPGLSDQVPGEQGVLLAAGHALVDETGPQRVGVIMTAAVAAEAARPARPEQVFTTLFVGPESGVELKEILREIVGQHASLRQLVCIATLTTI